MTDPWFTDPDSSGEVLLTWHDECWYVKSPDADSDIKCLLQGDPGVDPDDSPERLSGTVSKYMRGSGDRPDYLYLRPEEKPDSPVNDSEPVATGQSKSGSQSSTPINKKTDTGQAPSTTSASSPSSGQTSATQSSTRRRPSGSKDELDEIVADKIGDEEFTITQEDRESAIGKAKRRARNQQRDPAIDPKLQNDEQSEE